MVKVLGSKFMIEIGAKAQAFSVDPELLLSYHLDQTTFLSGTSARRYLRLSMVQIRV